MHIRRFFNFLILLAVATTHASGSDDVLIVLSSNLKPYQDALKGVESGLVHGFSSVILSEKKLTIPETCKTVIAIGGKAALYDYPEHMRLIYCLAPGLKREPKAGQVIVQILTSPPLLTLAARFKTIQPSLKRLGVIWISKSMEDYLNGKEKIYSGIGVEIISRQMKSSDDLPDALRSLNGKIDALWLPPDPVLISDKNFLIIKEFSWANHIPFYVPMDSLTERGAVGSVWSSFEDIGRLAAEAARATPMAKEAFKTIYPSKTHTTINLTAAKENQEDISLDVIKTADRILP